MFAPVFFWELDHISRRHWFANVRRLYALVVLMYFGWYVLETSAFYADVAWYQYMRFRWLTPEYMDYLQVIHVLTVFLLTPIFAITGVTQARNRHLLDLLLTTKQRPFEIVASYWLASVVKVMLVILPGVPLLFWLGSLWGTPWWIIVVRLTFQSLLALPIAAWSVLMTLRFRHIIPVMVLSYAGLLGVWLSVFAFFKDAELRTLSLGNYDPVLWQRYFLYIAVPTTMFVFIATMRLRDWTEGVRLPATKARDAHFRPPVAENPVFWKQFYFHDFSLIGALGRWPSWGRIAVYGILSCIACSSPPHIADLTPQFEMVVFLVAFPVGALIVAASTASVERESSTWDPLRVTLIEADEYFDQTLNAVLVHMKSYWLATLPAVAILACKRGEIGLLAPVVWGMAGNLMQPAAIFGLSSSVRAQSASQSILRALVLFLAMVGVVGFVVFTVLVGFIEFSDHYSGFIIGLAFHGQGGVALLTLLHLLCTWLILRFLLAWYARRQLGAAIAFLSESERFQAAP